MNNRIISILLMVIYSLTNAVFYLGFVFSFKNSCRTESSYSIVNCYLYQTDIDESKIENLKTLVALNETEILLSSVSEGMDNKGREFKVFITSSINDSKISSDKIIRRFSYQTKEDMILFNFHGVIDAGDEGYYMAPFTYGFSEEQNEYYVYISGKKVFVNGELGYSPFLEYNPETDPESELLVSYSYWKENCKHLDCISFRFNRLITENEQSELIGRLNASFAVERLKRYDYPNSGDDTNYGDVIIVLIVYLSLFAATYVIVDAYLKSRIYKNRIYYMHGMTRKQTIVIDWLKLFSFAVVSSGPALLICFFIWIYLGSPTINILTSELLISVVISWIAAGLANAFLLFIRNIKSSRQQTCE